MTSLNRALWLAVPAWGLAFALVPVFFPVGCIIYHHTVARHEIQLLRNALENEFGETANVSLDMVNDSDFWKQNPLEDAWDNPYRLVIRHEPDQWGNENPIHVYSCGENGSTDSIGNDADDINSWNYDHSRFYGPKVVTEYNRKRWVDSFSIWPFTLGLLYLLLNCALAICKRFGT